MTAARYDAVVVGGGPAGAAAALALARAGAAVALVERTQYDGWRVGETLRAEAQQSLAALGLWERFVAAGHRPSYAVRAAWGGDALVERNAIFDRWGPGWHVDRLRFDAMIAAAASEAGAAVLRGARVAAIASLESGYRVTLEARPGAPRTPPALEAPFVPPALEAPFLIDASGRSCAVVRALGGRSVAQDRLVGLAGVIAPGPGAGADAVEELLLLEAARDGWWYSVPLPDGTLLATYMTDADLAGGARHAATSWFAALGRTTHTRARVESLGVAGGAPAGDAGARAVQGRVRVRMRPAHTARTEGAAARGHVAIGDAAAALDPLSGSGITRALSDGLAVAAALGSDCAPARDAALAALAAAAARRFCDFLAQRAVVYGQEARFADARFWRRRRTADPAQAVLTLDPRAALRATEPPAGAAGAPELADRLAPAEAVLGVRDAERLLALCRAPAARPAHEVVAEFRVHAAPHAGDRHAIVALQQLVHEGLVEARPPGATAR